MQLLRREVLPRHLSTSFRSVSLTASTEKLWHTLCAFFTVKYLPSWFPGSAPIDKARSVRGIVRNMIDSPYENVKSAMVRSPINHK